MFSILFYKPTNLQYYTVFRLTKQNITKDSLPL